MKEEEFENIGAITLISDPEIRYSHSYGKCYFKPNYENGEMAQIRWIEIWVDGVKIAYVPQSNCVIEFKTNK